MGGGLHPGAGTPDAASVPAVLDMSTEADVVGGLRPDEVPRVRRGQPVLRGLDLASVVEALLEQAVLVAQAVAQTGAAQCGHGLHVAGRQPAQPAVAEGGVRLIVGEFGEAEAQLVECLFGDVAQPEIDRGVLEEPADEELHGQVVDALAVIGPGPAGRFEPGGHRPVADRVGQGESPVGLRGVVRILADGELEVVQQPPAERVGGRLGQREIVTVNATDGDSLGHGAPGGLQGDTGVRFGGARRPDRMVSSLYMRS